MVVLLGFIDDVIDLRWSHKFIVPTIASVPIVATYKGMTCVVVPKILRSLVGGNLVDLDFIYYVYMLMLAIFCTNSINIYAGLNGLEVGQSLIIGCFILMHNIMEMKLNEEGSVIGRNPRGSIVINHRFLIKRTTSQVTGVQASSAIVRNPVKTLLVNIGQVSFFYILPGTKHHHNIRGSTSYKCGIQSQYRRRCNWLWVRR